MFSGIIMELDAYCDKEDIREPAQKPFAYVLSVCGMHLVALRTVASSAMSAKVSAVAAS